LVDVAKARITSSGEPQRHATEISATFCIHDRADIRVRSMPQFDFLVWLAQPWFVLSWYGVGIVGAIWVWYDTSAINDPVPQALKWAWPIIVLFFSIVGLVLYVWTCRPPGIGHVGEEERKRIFREYAGGDGLGIMTAMVLARVWSMDFWQEFWFEYAVGFAFGWFFFPNKSMRAMTDGPLQPLWRGGRAEFFSMMTVMAGMGAVMAFVTPLVVGQQPPPDTTAFWGFAALGLLVGFVITYPMNSVLVRIGWKHGTVH
jgi:hypothetical protein